MADIRPFRRKRQPFPIPEIACVIIGAMGGDLPARYGARFSLRRRKAGVEVMFNVPGFTWNVTHLEGVTLPNFAAARAWVHAYAARFGQTVVEVVNPRTARPAGKAAKALKAGECHEAWLASDIPALWAEAMVRCQHPAGFCGEDGYCHYGDCAMQMLDA